MEYQSLVKLIKNKYGLHFTDLPENGGEGLALKKGQAPFMVLHRQQSVRIDVRCYSFADAIRDLPGFGQAFYHHDREWVGFDLSAVSDRAVENIVDYAFRAAVNAGREEMNQQQYVILPEGNSDDHYQAQTIPQADDHHSISHQDEVPAPLQRALTAYDYSLLPGERRDKNFYDQGQLLADYEDDYPDAVPLKRYFPTYHTLDTAQLRTYFTWRTKLRRGEFTPVADSYAYLYIYELLNNIGVSTPEAGFRQLLCFKDKYADQFDRKMGNYLDRWLHDYVLYYRLDHKIANQVFAAELTADRDFHIFLHPEDYPAAKLTAAFAHHSTYLQHSRLYQKSTTHFESLLKQVWQTVLQLPNGQGQQYFDHYVARQQLTSNFFFGNAVFYFHPRQQMAEYPVDSVRRYQFKGRQYYCQAFSAQPGITTNLNAFLHEFDRLIRQHFHLGHPLKARWLPQAVLTAVDQGIRDYQRQLQEARRLQVQVDLGDVEQIRQAAAETQARLLTAEERQAIKEEQATAPKQATTPPAPGPQPTEPATQEGTSSQTDRHGLTTDQLFLLRALLQGTPWKDYLKKHHLMVSIVADQVNATLFDEVGDDVIEFDANDQPQIIADYRPDLEKMFLT